LLLALDPAPPVETEMTDDEADAIRRMFLFPGYISGIPANEIGPNFLA
jgi:hypothetical protein